MTGDMVVALSAATADGHTRFGRRGSMQGPTLLTRVSGRACVPGERLRVRDQELAQARQTYTVVGSQSKGVWGFEHGVNERGVAAGCVSLPATHAQAAVGLVGPDLTRLALERGPSAAYAVEALTHLLEQHGAGMDDHAFLVADATEAFAVETAGKHWVYQEVKQVRAVSNVRVIRQDWDRISSGLAQHAISQGRWPGDGSKLDFAVALGAEGAARDGGLRRWGRATLLLEQRNGRLNTTAMRQALAIEDLSTARTTLLAELTSERPAIVWWALGPTELELYFPLFVDGELPEALAGTAAEVLEQRLRALAGQGPEAVQRAREGLEQLQARLEQEADEFATEGTGLRQRGETDALRRQAGLTMQHHVECVEEALTALAPRRPTLRGPRRRSKNR